MKALGCFSAIAPLLLSASTGAMCNHGTRHFPRSLDGIKVANFDYDHLSGPLNWFGLDESANDLCARGKYQSPINILGDAMPFVSGRALDFQVHNYPAGAEEENLGSTVEVLVNGTMVRDGVRYSLKQFHVHTPSEHRLNGEYFAMELHFVCEGADGALAVVAFLVDVDVDGDELLFRVFEHIDDVATPGSMATTGPLDFDSLEGHLMRSSVYQYEGSLTTPPCTESIKWNVVREPMRVDLRTYHKVKRVVRFNARYTQNISGGLNLLDYARIELDTH